MDVINSKCLISSSSDGNTQNANQYTLKCEKSYIKTENVIENVLITPNVELTDSNQQGTRSISY